MAALLPHAGVLQGFHCLILATAHLLKLRCALLCRRLQFPPLFLINFALPQPLLSLCSRLRLENFGFARAQPHQFIQEFGIFPLFLVVNARHIAAAKHQRCLVAIGI